MAYETGILTSCSSRKPSGTLSEPIADYEASVADQISRILSSDQYSVVIESAR